MDTVLEVELDAQKNEKNHQVTFVNQNREIIPKLEMDNGEIIYMYDQSEIKTEQRIFIRLYINRTKLRMQTSI